MEKQCAVLNMLEKGCPLVVRDGIILGNDVMYPAHFSRQSSLEFDLSLFD